MVAIKNQTALHRAPFALRCGAFLIDYTLLVTILACVTLVARPLGGSARLSGSTVETFGYLLVLVTITVNFVLLTLQRGQTFGKWVTGLRIERANGESLSLKCTLLRHLIGYPLSLLTFGLGFLLAAFDNRGRTLHDRIAGTIVVRAGASRRRVHQVGVRRRRAAKL